MRSDNPPHRDEVPLLDLKAQYAPLRDEILSAIARVCDSQRFIMGPEVEALEHELSVMLGVRHAVAVSSGTDALLLALMALGIERGDEVITSSYSFFATAGAIARLGATPVFVDINPETYNIDVAQVRAAITPRTRAILPVHLFGLPADMDAVMEVAASRDGIAVIEDAAQAIGATYHGRSAGSIGRCGCFSFFPSKNLGAFGEAGLFTTNDDALAARAKMLRVHGMEPKYHHSLIGGNFRMDALQAAILRVKAPHLQAWTEGRRENARRYLELFRQAGVADQLVLPIELPDRRHIFNQFVIRSTRRDGLRAHLAALGIGSEVYYPIPLHLQTCFAYLGYRQGSFPHSERAATDSLALPIYAELTVAQQQQVVDGVAEFVTAATPAGTGGSARA
jgi:dTDP-4-amino-4,6-dideoxygalactose transaminase